MAELSENPRPTPEWRLVVGATLMVLTVLLAATLLIVMFGTTVFA